MKISYNWLKQFLKVDWEAIKTGELLTDLGLEVEGIETVESIKGSLKGIIVGEVLTCVQHPNADRLRVTTVNTLFGNNSSLVSTLTFTGLDSGARITIPITITKSTT